MRWIISYSADIRAEVKWGRHRNKFVMEQIEILCMKRWVEHKMFGLSA
jgi:hypothetical protein